MPMCHSIPLLDLHKEYDIVKNDIKKELAGCFAGQDWILGNKVKEFERKASGYLGAGYAVGVASGTDALLLSLHALCLHRKKRMFFDKKDEIITTPFTFIATAEAIVRSGATPVFIDVDEKSFNIDPDALEKAVTPRTVGILPVHLFGQAADMEAITKIARRHKLFVVEDAAQAFGAAHKNKKLGTWGDCGAFSFFPSKTLGGYGDAGMITTNNKKLAQDVTTLRNHGQTKTYNAAYIGFNSRLDSIQAAILLSKMKYVDRWNRRRIALAGMYHAQLRNIKQVAAPAMRAVKSTGAGDLSHIYSVYTLIVSTQRDKLCGYLNRQGISARVYYPYGLDRMRPFRSAKAVGGLCVTRRLTRQVLSLPIHPFLTQEEIKRIASTIRNFYS